MLSLHSSFISRASCTSHPTVDVLGGFVGIVLHNQLDQVHALNSEAFEGHSFPRWREQVADGELQGTLD